MGLFGRQTLPIGLDIGTNTFRGVQISASAGSKPRLEKYGSVKVPLGAVVEGEIVDVEAASFALGQLWKKAGFNSKNVVIGLASPRVVVRLIDLPYMNEDELNNAIKYQAQDYIPIPLEEAILDAKVVGEFLNENEEKMIEVLLIAAQKDIINNIVKASEAVGLKPQVIDLSAFAIVRSLLPEQSFFNEEGGSVVALVNISAGNSNIVVVDQGTPKFARNTPIGGNDLTQTLADTLGLQYEEAEELKIKVGLPTPQETDTNNIVAQLPENLKGHVEAAQSVIENYISQLAAEIRRSLDYYLTQVKQVKTIEQLIISGGGSHLKGLNSYLERLLQVQVIIGQPLAQFEMGKMTAAEEVQRDEASLAISLGLALRGLS